MRRTDMECCKKIKNKKILVVDEDKQFTDKIAKFLELKHFKCVISNEVSVGVLMILEDEFDIVVLRRQRPACTHSADLSAPARSSRPSDAPENSAWCALPATYRRASR